MFALSTSRRALPLQKLFGLVVAAHSVIHAHPNDPSSTLVLPPSPTENGQASEFSDTDVKITRPDLAFG